MNQKECNLFLTVPLTKSISRQQRKHMILLKILRKQETKRQLTMHLLQIFQKFGIQNMYQIVRDFYMIFLQITRAKMRH